MNKFTIELERPRFRPGVTIAVEGDAVHLDYREQGCTLEVPRHTAELKSLVEALGRGRSTAAELLRDHEALADALPGMLRELDALGLLLDAAPPLPAMKSGAQLYRDLVRFVERAKLKTASSEFYRGLVEGTLSERQLIGYAIEYYHLVYQAPTLLAPALASLETPKTRNLLIRFYESELNHDRFLTAALRSVGVSEDLLLKTTPLPSTFALCASLAAYARQHMLTFKAALFLFEQPYEEFNSAFRTHCARVGMPKKFFESIVRHAELNESEEHEVISERLLADVPCVASEEQTVVKKHIGILVETLARQEREILTYYGNPSNPSPRLFS
jgi:thiaminase